MKIKLILIFFLLSASRLTAAETPGLKSNFEIFNELSAQCVQEVLDGNLAREVKKVLLQKIDTADSLNWFIENTLFNLLKQHGVDSIQYGEAASGFGQTVLVRYKIVNLSLSYENENRWRLFNRTHNARHFKLQFFLQLINPQQGTVLWSGVLAREFRDQVPPNQIAGIESSAIPFTQARYPNRSIYARFVEPVLILSTTGTIIYLFYAFRSQ